MNKYLPKEVYIGCSISIILVILVGFLSLYMTKRQSAKETSIEHTYQVLGQVKLVEGLLMDMETGRRAFRATDNKTFLEPYYSSLPKMTSGLDQLEKMTQTEPRQISEVHTLKKRINELFNFWKGLGADASMYTRDRIYEITQREKAKMQEVRQQIVSISDDQQTILVQHKKSSNQIRQKTIAAIVTGTLLILVIVSVLIYVVIREFRTKVQAFQTEHEINEQKSAFISLASHEFRTPLSSINLSASLIQKYTGQSNPENVLKHTHKIKVAVEHLTTILNDFLSLGRLDKGKIEPVFENFDLAELSAEIKEEMEVIVKTDQTIVYSHSGATSRAKLDKTLLKNCLINLISNAIKYSGDNTKIEYSTKVTGDECIITVKDDGIGIPEADQKHLFQPFFRATNTGTIPGTGLGLNIVARYVELMNGSLSFESRVNKGSSFVLKFPLQGIHYPD